MKWYLLFTVAAGLVSYLLLTPSKNNVCKTFEDYYSNRDKNPNCYYNSDHELAVPEIAKRFGYPIEEYNVTTADGYILTVFRIPHGKESNRTSSKPVFLQHGFSINCGAFLITGKKSLALMLVDAGYDVWLGNFRGTRYSNKHTFLDNNSAAFWNFSFHENGVYDLPAQINLVSNVTQQKITYIGYSMGTTAAYVYFSVYPHHQKLDLFIGLAPAIYAEDVAFITSLSNVWKLIATPIQYLTNGKTYPRYLIPQTIFKYVCLPLPFQIKMCQLIDMLAAGFNYEENDPETLPVSWQHNSDAASVNTFWHFDQLADSNQFQYYDYGEVGNQNMYNRSTPPTYNISQIYVDNHLFYATNDKLSTVKNVRRLYRDLPTKNNSHKLYKIEDDNLNHIHILTGRNAHNLVNNRVIDLLNSKK